jgi:hypothetical protein
MGRFALIVLAALLALVPGPTAAQTEPVPSIEGDRRANAMLGCLGETDGRVGAERANGYDRTLVTTSRGWFELDQHWSMPKPWPITLVLDDAPMYSATPVETVEAFSLDVVRCFFATSPKRLV